MKKLLVLVLALGMASAVSGGNVAINGPATANWGDTITLTIQTTSGFDARDMYIEKLSDGDFGGTAHVGTIHAGWELKDPGYTGAECGYADGYLGYIYGGFSYPATIAGPTTLYTWTYTIPGGSGTDTLTFTIINEGEYMGYVTDQNYDWYTPSSHAVVVPEPMTIALLGLGGLLLCRRHK